jgi:hypothetical protein
MPTGHKDFSHHGHALTFFFMCLFISLLFASLLYKGGISIFKPERGNYGYIILDSGFPPSRERPRPLPLVEMTKGGTGSKGVEPIF